ncbi:adenylate kinase family protein [Roseibacillus persicicus]|uniref:Adenylate kinase n=1 Tax=Roseibacillus persicicus TaxID=454148 RepID=A0A918WIT6_9BACT|nr:nucleoside monophosphate kinase [Roseibacillus persicicus]MDQ8191671.1 nucleoside monophosphate kinase [Roseibacillus persicicus]GHC51691.1 adenylate kinase [Roseibacillus persicicus]
MSEKPKMSAILLLGAPGAGKGTLGKTLGAIPRFFHCACGDVFRSLDTRTRIGQEFVRYSSSGELVPDELTVELWRTQMRNWADTHVYKPDIDLLILDGIPRNVRQAEIMEESLIIHQVIHLSCPERSELARRMRKRALKENRYDDANDAVIEQRIRTYEEETKPILEFYGPKMVADIDATGTPVKVLYDVIERLMQLQIYKDMAGKKA